MNFLERIARAQREIEAIEAEIRAGNPDVQGLCRGLVDWACELRRLEKEQAEQGDLAGTATGGSADDCATLAGMDSTAEKPAAAGAGRAREGA